MLTASGLSVAHGTRTLFTDASITLSPGRRIALVGGNGTGKTTLLEILVGRGEPDSGTVTRPADYRVGYLPQETMDIPAGSVLETVVGGAGEVADVGSALHRVERDLATAVGAARDRALERFGELQTRFQNLGGYAVESDAHRILVGLGFHPNDADRRVSELSGGWRMRVALARLLVGGADLLILDEPTNHLDVDSVAWLEQHLAGLSSALLFVSHDRDFIDAVANRVIELSGGRTQEYVGGFAEFVVAREERISRLEAAAAQQSRKLAQTERFVERFRYKATKARQVQSRIKALEKINRIEIPDDATVRARFNFPTPPRCSRVVAELHDVRAAYDPDHVVLDGVDLVVERGDRIALVGPNGAGKTTLLKLILGQLAPMQGTVSVGSGVKVASFHQHQAESLNPERTVLDEFRYGLPELPNKLTRGLLGSFGFSGDAVDKRVATLSGGERTRLALGKLMATPANVLVLDEPTNHLDLPSCDMLEDALRAYDGVILLVTHDRHLIRSVATGIVVVRDGRASQHLGVDEDLLRAPSSEASTQLAAAVAPPPRQLRVDQRRADADRRNSRHRDTKELRRQVSQAERKWEQAEQRLAELQRQLADPEIYADAPLVKALVAEHNEAKDRAAQAMSRWERLATDLERAEARYADGS